MGTAVLRSDDAAVWGRFLGANSVRENRQSAVHGLQPKASNYLACEYSDVSGLKSSHSSSSSLQRPQHGDGDDPMLSARITRTSPDPKSETRTQLQRALALHVTDPAKVAARKVAASPDTVESHRQNVPKSWTALIAYCRAYPAFGLDVLEMMGIDIDRDRDAYALFLQLQKQVRGE